MTLAYHPALTAPIRVPDYILVEQPSRKRCRAEDVVREICAWYGLQRADIRGATRLRHIAHARQMGMFIARKNTRLSLPQIGAAFGGRDHSTVIHAIRQVETRLATDDDLRADHDAIVEALRG